MKLKELALDVNIKGLKIELTDELFNIAKEGGLDTKVVYIAGLDMGDYFVKKKPSDLRNYPLLVGTYALWDLLKECEILDKRYKRKRNQSKL